MRRLRTALLVITLLIAAAAALARVGGGQSYSGGSSGSSSGGGGGRYSGGSSRSSGGSSSNGPTTPIERGCTFLIVVVGALLFGIAVIHYGRVAQRAGTSFFVSTNNPTPVASGARLDDLRRFDPNFSRIVFDDFCYSLFARVHQVRGAGDIGRYAPYLSDDAQKTLALLSFSEVQGIVVGALEVGNVEGLDTPVVSVDVTYDANITEVIGAGRPVQSSWYVREQWRFERTRDILSPPPAKAKAEHCPRCGAALQTRTDGACEFCGVKIVDGSFQWYVRKITPLSKEARGPLLTSNVPEQGTDLPTIRDPLLEQRLRDFDATHPGFRMENVIARVQDLAVKLQDAWTTRNWERARPLETDPLFQMHRYWIDACIKQHLKNVVDEFKVERMLPVKVDSDAFFDAITVRQWSSGRDYTVDDDGVVVAGSRDSMRRWSEYWTLIRSRATQSDPSATVACPNCGAAVVIGPTAVCSHCGGKLTTGDFDWVLSRIEQDEAYTG